MTNEDLKRANELQKEINELRGISIVLRDTLNNNKPTQFKRFLRFCNSHISSRCVDRPQDKAEVFLFTGLHRYGEDLPVDLDLVECLKQFFDKKLKEKQDEFEQIGRE